ncbi:hypothetical protein Tco_1208071 [Tanacetum coccineum]
MVTYLQKPEGSEVFHQIVDFLNAGHMKEVEIIASIDGKVKTITEASLRRHLKLEDSDGIASLPNIEIFEQLALMGGAATTDIGLEASQGSGTMHKTPTRPHDSPLLRVHTLGSDEGKNDMQQTKKVYSFALTKLILRVKKLEKKVKTNKARRRAMIVILEDEDTEEDSSKQGRKISEIDEDSTISLVHLEQDIEYDFYISTTKGFTTASVPVTTASSSISSISPPRVSTTKDISGAETLVYIRRSEEKRKDKGKAIMKEDESI